VKRRSLFRALIAKARDRVMIMPYRTYGTAQKLSVCGRVLQDEGIRPARGAERRLRSLVAFYKRLESDEVPGARVRARLDSVEREAVTDREGYFSINLPCSSSSRATWNEVELELVRDPSVRAVAEVLVPRREAQFGIISDIDDTVIQSNVLSKTRMLLTVALSNAHMRKPFRGAAAFYRALHRGVNPFFYVSKSPWNLYAPLLEFFALQGLPPGPLLLRDFGLHALRKSDHKGKNIEKIFKTYPKLEFVLIGDSGDEDPELYAGIVRRHPRRVRVIYIRSVDPAPARLAAIDRLVREVARTGCQLVLAPDSELAAAHAAGEGLIQASDLRRVREDRSSEASMLSKVTASTGSL
jgi:phosphatidate phosphatase APP1